MTTTTCLKHWFTFAIEYFRAGVCHASALMAAMILTCCSTASNRELAPATGTFGGMAAGAVIGSTSGNVGTGAVLGGMLGRAGGETVRAANAPGRGNNDALILHHLPDTLKEARRFDESLGREYSSLTQRRQDRAHPESLVAKAVARDRLRETDAWIAVLNSANGALSEDIRKETRYPTGNLSFRLKQREEVNRRLNSIRNHRSWLRSVSS